MKRLLIAGALLLATVSTASADNVYQAKCDTATELVFGLHDLAGTALATGLTCADTGAALDSDVRVSENEATAADATNCFNEIATSTGMYSLVIPAGELSEARTVYKLDDQTDPKAWIPKVLVVETYGCADSQHDTAEVSVTEWNGTAVLTPDTAGAPKVSIIDGTGTGEINTSSGEVDCGSTGGGGGASCGPIVE